MTSFTQSKNYLPLGRSLSVMGKGYLHLLRAKLKHLDINRNYYALILIDAGDGVINQQELAGKLDSDKVSIVRIVDYLTAKGYVTRVNVAGDRRKHCLALTGKAKQALPEIKAAICEINELVLEGLDNSQVSLLTEAFSKIKTNITENIITL